MANQTDEFLNNYFGEYPRNPSDEFLMEVGKFADFYKQLPENLRQHYSAKYEDSTEIIHEKHNYNGITVWRDSHSKMIRVKELEKHYNVTESKKFHKFTKTKSSLEIIKENPTAWKTIKSRCYVREEYIESYLSWLKIEPVTIVNKFKNDGSYGLLVYINNQRRADDKVELNVCKRINYAFLHDKPKHQIITNNQYLIYYVGKKEDIYKFRDDVIKHISKIDPDRHFVPHTQGSKLLIDKNKIKDIEKDLRSYNEFLNI